MKPEEDLSVSVVIPVYNGEAFIDQSIESVLNQTHQDLQLIVIDDGSKDNTRAVVEQTFSRFPQNDCAVISRENRGVCRTLNEGLGISQGKYFAYIGHDDIWERNKLELQIAELRKTGFAAAYSDCLIIDAAGKVTGRYGEQYPFRGGRIYEDLVWMKFQPASPTVLFSREVVEEVGGFDESQIWEDRDLWIRIARDYEVAYLDLPLARYRVHGSNSSTSDLERMRRYSMQVLEATLDRDPSLQKYRGRMEARIEAFFACSQYEKLDLVGARKTAISAIRKYPFSYLAFRTLLLSYLGEGAISKARSWRRT